MPTDYHAIRSATRARRERERISLMSPAEAMTEYSRLLIRGRRYDELKDILLDRAPDIEARPSQHTAGDARIIIGRCEVPESAPRTILFVMRVSVREAVYPVRLQGGGAAHDFHQRRPAGERRPRLEYRMVRRHYQLASYDANADHVRVISSFTNSADARVALRKAVAGAI